MADYCTVYKMVPWVDRNRDKPAPEKVEDVALPERLEGESDSKYYSRRKEYVRDWVFDRGDLELRTTPSIVADKSKTNGAIMVAYCTVKSPSGTRFKKKKPVRRDGIAAQMSANARYKK